MGHNFKTLVGKRLGALKVSSPRTDTIDRSTVDAVAPSLHISFSKSATGKGSKTAPEDDDTEIISVEPKRRSTVDHAYHGKRALVISGNKIVGAQG